MKFTAFELGHRSPADVVVTGNIVQRCDIPEKIKPGREPVDEQIKTQRAAIARHAVRKCSSHRELADRIGVDVGNISAWVCETNPVPDRYIQQLARIAYPEKSGEVAV